MTFDWNEYKSNVWRPTNIGDSITGTVVALDVRKGRSGDNVPIVIVEEADGDEREVWASAFDLKSQLADAAPQVGDVLTITFTGERHTGQPSPMKLFTVDIAAGNNGEVR